MYLKLEKSKLISEQPSHSNESQWPQLVAKGEKYIQRHQGTEQQQILPTQEDGGEVTSMHAASNSCMVKF